MSGTGVVYSEFAQISVEIDENAKSPRLRLEDLRTGQTRYLDALVLEALVWLSEDAMERLLDPSADRWREDRDLGEPGTGTAPSRHDS
ncbi:hypothetical protein OPAG_06889 [Rhodococcus opacus PD630]|nr:hypothetical protein [Rhodococcus opacus]EHI43604.1 hypothetical protein OPAG_06889 [Rhodococcus opacus PD630]